MAGISPLGNDWPGVRARLGEYRNAVARMPEWAGYDGLNTLLGAPAAEFTLSERYTTKTTRSMAAIHNTRHLQPETVAGSSMRRSHRQPSSAQNSPNCAEVCGCGQKMNI